MSYEKPFELGWYGMGELSDMELAKKALSEARIDQEWAKDGYVTTTLYSNNLFFCLFRKSKPPKKYFNSANASVFEVTNGEFATLYHRNQPPRKPDIQENKSNA